MSSASTHSQPPGSIEQRICNIEERLGLQTRPEILIEAALVIDKKFLDTAIIMGIPAKPERIFGDNAWLSYLEARLLAKQYGDQPLTRAFITNLHQQFLNNLFPNKRSSLTAHGGRGGRYRNGQFSSMKCTPEQIAIINNNSLLRFLPDETLNDPNRGYIQYPTMPVKERQRQLDQICAAHNAASQTTRDPYSVAAVTQRCFVSLHPLSYDFSGRVSRLIMNWSLENAGKNPSIISDMENDLLLTEKDWVDCVRQGSVHHATYKERAATGETDLITLFSLQQKKLRYDSYSDKSKISPPPLLGNNHNHDHYDTFLTRLKA